jgi:ATP-binding cassette subfamily C (CFTR/MRP) protein 1
VDDIVILGAGQVKYHGPYSELPSGIDLGIEPNSIPAGLFQSTGSDFETPLDTTRDTENSEANMVEVPEMDTVEADFSRRDGSWSVYSYYIRSAGVISCILFVALIAIAAFTTNFPSNYSLSLTAEFVLTLDQLCGFKCGQMLMRNTQTKRLSCIWVSTL